MSKIKKMLIISMVVMVFLSSTFPFSLSQIQTDPMDLSSDISSSQNESFSSTVFPPPSQNVSISLKQTLKTNNFLYTQGKEELAITNGGDLPFNGLRMFFPSQLWEKMEGISATGALRDKSKAVSWEVYIQKASYIGIRCHFPWFIEEGESFNMTLSFHLPRFGELYSNSAGEPIFNYQFTGAPRFLHQVEDVKSRFLPPKEGSMTGIRGEEKESFGDEISYEKPFPYPIQFNSSIKAKNIATEIEVICELGALPLQLSYFSREITYKLSNQLRIYEEYTFSSKPTSITYPSDLKTENIEIGVLKNAKNITARDSLGEISYKEQQEVSESKNIQVNCRVPVKPGSRYHFTLSYKLNESGKYLERKNPDKPFDFQANLTLPTAPLINSSVITSIFRLSIPSALSIRYEKGPDNVASIETTSTSVLAVAEIERKTWVRKNVFPFQRNNLQLIFHNRILAYFQIFARLMLIIFCVFVLVLLSLKYFPKKTEHISPEKVKKQKEKEKLRSYITRLERFTALEDRVDEEIAESLVGSGGRTYEEIATATEKIEDRREQLYERGKELKENPSFREPIRKLERITSDLAMERSLILQRWQKQSEKKVMKSAFEDYVKDLLNSLNKLRIKRESAFNALKERLSF